ncbi:ATP-binding cassette domain-containing protein [uncultured Agrococcus sp.]|uniref:ABC transporter ATP-binding protein n=1 Tax=uncultured Agrococcus sp. TaxID=382258 RepID=UPI0025D7218D|nr:ATP-binding cassette domain-containing protein [uncultured Agrococcus sp.]
MTATRTRTATTATLRVENLGIAYVTAEGRPFDLVTGLSFEAGPGELVCLAGRSGSGKTSILRQLIGLADGATGTISWNDRTLASMDASDTADLRRRLAAYLDQEAGLVEELTCLENVVLPAVPNGRRQAKRAVARAREHLERLGLAKREGVRPATLSGGERQRTVLARVLTAGTPAIIADEPTASLDRSWAEAVIMELRNHADAGGTVVTASHDPGLAEAADRVIRIET